MKIKSEGCVVVNKGDLVVAHWFEVSDPTRVSLAGVQTKFQAKARTASGVVRHVRSSHPTQLVDVTLHVQVEAPEGQMCPKCGVHEVEIKPEWVVSVAHEYPGKSR
jgi:hypothetical protein